MTGLWKRLKDRLKDAGASTGKVVRDATVSTGEVLKDAGVKTGEVLKVAAEVAGRSTSEAARAAADLYEHRFGEDTGKILADCPIAKNILQHREVFETDPEVFSRLYNVRIRPLVTAAALGAGGAGAVA